MADNALKRRNALMDASQGVSKGFWADGIGGPVDMLTTLANLGIAGGGYAGHKLGLLSQPPELIQNPVGGSEWIAAKMRSNGLLNDNPGSTADAYGRAAGGLLAPLTAARAPQIANALQQAPAALQRGAYAVGEKAAGMAENQLVRQGGILPVNPLQQRSGLLDSAPVQSMAANQSMTPKELKAELLAQYKRLAEESPYSHFGVRVLGPDQPTQVGKSLPRSSKWVDGVPLSTKLPGTAVFELRGRTAEAAIEHALAYNLGGKGQKLALVQGEELGLNMMPESFSALIKRPRVLSLHDRPSELANVTRAAEVRKLLQDIAGQ